MKLYLSSYGLCSKPNAFKELFGCALNVAIVRNALDFSNDKERLDQGARREIQEVKSLGLEPSLLDLRNFFNKSISLEREMSKFGGVWVVGGNSFILRKAMKYSGFDEYLKKMVGNPNFVYGGYSAGACVLAPTLKGIHLVDHPEIVPAGYQEDENIDGLGIIDFCIAPHYKSNHPESELMQKVIEYFIENKMPFIALKDGESLIIEK